MSASSASESPTSGAGSGASYSTSSGTGKAIPSSRPFHASCCANPTTSASHLLGIAAERRREVVGQLAERALAVEEAEHQRGGVVEHHHARGPADHHLLAAHVLDDQVGEEARDELGVDGFGFGAGPGTGRVVGQRGHSENLTG